MRYILEVMSLCLLIQISLRTSSRISDSVELNDSHYTHLILSYLCCDIFLVLGARYKQNSLLEVSDDGVYPELQSPGLCLV